MESIYLKSMFRITVISQILSITINFPLYTLWKDLHNVYALLGRARQALKTGGREDLIEPMTEEVFASKSYEEAIGHICEYVQAE